MDDFQKAFCYWTSIGYLRCTLLNRKEDILTSLLNICKNTEMGKVSLWSS